MSDSQQADAHGLSFTDELSVTWRRVEAAPDEARLAMVNESNESFLRAVSVIGASAGEYADEEVASSPEIARLDLKVNLLLELVSELVYQQVAIPPRRRVTISTQDILWRESDPPDPGETVLVQVYIQHGTPKPLSFYGVVQTPAPDVDGSGCTRVRFLGLSASAQSALDRLVFRHHRREVAFRRRRQPAP